MFQWLLSWCINEEKVIWYQLELGNYLADISTFALMTTGAFSRNVGKIFSELKLVPDNLFFIYSVNIGVVLNETIDLFFFR